MTFADKRLRVIARKYSRQCETKTIGHDKTSDGRDAWVVVPWKRSAIESVIFAAIKEAMAKRVEA